MSVVMRPPAAEVSGYRSSSRTSSDAALGMRASRSGDAPRRAAPGRDRRARRPTSRRRCAAAARQLGELLEELDAALVIHRVEGAGLRTELDSVPMSWTLCSSDKPKIRSARSTAWSSAASAAAFASGLLRIVSARSGASSVGGRIVGMQLRRPSGRARPRTAGRRHRRERRRAHEDEVLRDGRRRAARRGAERQRVHLDAEVLVRGRIVALQDRSVDPERGSAHDAHDARERGAARRRVGIPDERVVSRHAVDVQGGHRRARAGCPSHR